MPALLSNYTNLSVITELLSTVESTTLPKCLVYFSGVAEALRVANNSFEETSGLKRMRLSELSRKVSSHFDIKEEDLRSPKKKRSVTQAKSVFGYLSIKRMGYSGREVGKFLNMRGYSAIRGAEAGEIIIDTGSLALTSVTKIHQAPADV